MTAVRVVLTYEDYAALPNDGKRYEILDGELNVTAAPSRGHQRVVLKLAAALDAHVTSHGLGEVYVAPFDVILAETTIVQPDVIFVARDRLAIFSARGADGAPTLAVEVLSPSTSRVDRVTKLQLYARYGVRYYWIVDLDRYAIDVHVLTAGAYGPAGTFAGDALVDLPPFPGLRLDPASLWPERSASPRILDGL
jgi:Uma2 family endonuclease